MAGALSYSTWQLVLFRVEEVRTRGISANDLKFESWKAELWLT